MTEAELRRSREWREHRRRIAALQGNMDIVTGRPLRKGYQCHHLNLDKSQYDVLSDEDFICINRSTHEMIHWLWRYWRTDPAVIARLGDVMSKMDIINTQADSAS